MSSDDIDTFLSPRVARLPQDARGRPIPWFVPRLAGEVDHNPQAAIERKQLAARRNLCSMCGEALGVIRAFLIQPRSCLSRITSDPPSHPGCARDVVRLFTSDPPRLIALWVTRSYLRVGRGGSTFRIGHPMTGAPIEWWCDGRPATPDEVSEAVSAANRELTAEAEREPDLVRREEKMRELLGLVQFLVGRMPKHEAGEGASARVQP